MGSEAEATLLRPYSTPLLSVYGSMASLTRDDCGSLTYGYKKKKKKKCWEDDD